MDAHPPGEGNSFVTQQQRKELSMCKSEAVPPLEQHKSDKRKSVSHTEGSGMLTAFAGVNASVLLRNPKGCALDL